MKGCDFIFDCVDILHYKCHEVNLNRGESFIDSSNWTKNKSAAINPINDCDKCFEYATKILLNHEKIQKI